MVPLADASERHRRPVLAIAGVAGAAAALLIGVLIWQNDDDGPGENVATQDPTTVPATSEVPASTTVPSSTIAPATTVPLDGTAAVCPMLPDLDGATVQGETLSPALAIVTYPDPAVFGSVEGGAETYAESETFRVAAALPVRPVIDFVGERTANEGPVLLWWAGDGRVEAWVWAEDCDTVGISVTGGTRDQNAQAAAELAFRVADESGLELGAEPATDCPQQGSEVEDRPVLYFYCPFDDVDQVPLAVDDRNPFLSFSSPAETLQALFSADPPEGWGTGIPLVLRGAEVGLTVTDGVARLDVDYDFEAAPINGFSTSFMSLAYGNQLQATLFHPRGRGNRPRHRLLRRVGRSRTRADWEAWLAQATES